MRGSVRLRLLTGLVVLVTLGLAAVDVTTWGALRSFLVARVDSQLDATRRPVDAEMATALTAAQLTADVGVVRRGLPPGVFLQIRGPGGRVLTTVTPTDTGGNPLAPIIPDPLPKPKGARAVSPVLTVPGQSGDHFRLEVFNARFNTSVIVAVPLSSVTATLHRLVRVSLLASLITLVAVVVLALFVIRVGLHPLDAMADTASAIAGGDLSRRVRHADRRTEVGRLGLALNAMLGQIEAAFANRQASEDRLRRFVSDASHELRTPLTSIRGYAELFRSGAADRPADLAKAMGRIESEATRMGGLVDDLLLLARLDQGRPLEAAPVDLAALARDAVDDARAAVPDSPVVSEAASPVVVIGDSHQLRQVLANLVSNAQKHTPPGTPITVRAFGEHDLGVLEVCDAGPGLSREQVERVWDRFWRAERTPAAGSGLGLSIVAAIAHAHGGNATVESEPGKGATFRVTVPLATPTSPSGRDPSGADLPGPPRRSA